MSTTALSPTLLPSMTSVTMALPTQSLSPDNLLASRRDYLTGTTSSLIACVTPMIALMYLVVLSWTYRYSHNNPRPLNKSSSLKIQRYAPAAYVFLVMCSLAEVAIASWLILQYRFNHNYPNIETRTSARLLLFTSSWTVLTGGAYTLLFLHPVWSKRPISSIGAQTIWIFITWLFWVVGAGLVNRALPSLMDQVTCGQIVYCGQIRALFGVAVLESLILTAGMAAMLWLAWQSARYNLHSDSFSMHSSS
ncbi:hypothetical protein CVT24_009111 [Panaeolus cyanescens]|uniref:MARVEL domain-containing protein n=1 Tax=Panaeolus cyanescens TaxID=181874 RepID=A0A409VAL9_9AGAR|nr:hypothetical protein CVT24_009111 [Panaeolus cyanescens]